MNINTSTANLNEDNDQYLSDEFIGQLLESSKYPSLASTIEKNNLENLLRNTRDFNKNYSITEGTYTADVAQFTPILLPIVRRMYPNLIAHQILGVQPMSMPTGYIYAWVNKYTGDGNNGVNPSSKMVIAELEDDQTTANVGDTVNTDNKLLHKEGKLVLLSVGSTEVTVDTTQIGGKTVKKVYTNEAAFAHILQNYTGPYTTAAGETLGKDMKELGFEITKKAIEVTTRAVKTPFTVEMYQDLKAQHGKLADEELISLASYELQAEIDRECVAAVNSWAAHLPDTTFDPGDTNWASSTGRWDIEKFRVETIRIDKESALIGVANKRGKANTLIVSPLVAVMLQQMNNFNVAPVKSNINVPANGGYAGSFNGQYNIIVDQYAQNNYITALYKGFERTDAIGFYAPYVPINFTRVTNPDSAQPAIIAKTRYALTAIPGVSKADALDRAQTYASNWGVDFTNTTLA